MQLDVLGLLSIDTLRFLDGNDYLGGGGLSTAWISSLWNTKTVFYSVNSNKKSSKIIQSNQAVNKSQFRHISLNNVNELLNFEIYQDASEYLYKINDLQLVNNELTHFLSKSNNNKYIKLPAQFFYTAELPSLKFSVNPQGNYSLFDFCRIVNNDGLIFLNKKELLNSSKLSFHDALKYIQKSSHSFVVTLGNKGSVFYERNTDQWWYCPCIQSENCLSTLGCGDAYAGGFLSAYINNFSIYQCLSRATCSAYCATLAPGSVVASWLQPSIYKYFDEFNNYIINFSSAHEVFSFLTSNSTYSIALKLPLNKSMVFDWRYKSS